MSYLKKCIWNLAYANRKDLKVQYRQMSRLQWMDTHKIVELQRQKLRDILSHAFHCVPYYRDILRSSKVIKPSGAVDLDSFENIPKLTRTLLQDRFDELISNDIKKRNWYENYSGGSTGTPIRFMQDNSYMQHASACRTLFDSWTGYKFGAKKIILWGSLHDLSQKGDTFRLRWRRWIRNEHWLNSFLMTKDMMDNYVSDINRFKPFLILGYAESIYEFAKFVERSKSHIHSPMALMTSAGTLFPEMRATIERVFKSQVFNRYGTREVSNIACECSSHAGLHVNPLTHFVEILRPDGSRAGAGEIGQVVVTLLTNYAMPLIRYTLEDLAVWGEENCACGRKWPLLKQVLGRVSDSFTTKSGDIVNSLSIFPIFSDTKFSNAGLWVKKFQAVQETHSHLRILIVPRDNIKNRLQDFSADYAAISRYIRSLMGDDCRIDFEIVEKLQPTQSGKSRLTISKVASQWQ